MKKVSDVFKSIRFAKGEPRDTKHKSTDDEEHATVGELEFDQQLAHAKKRAMQEDLRKWFDKDDPEGGWKRINSKGEAIGPCAREPGEPKPKCMSNEKRAKLTKKERASAVRAKRKHDSDPDRKGAPINVSNFGKGKISEDMENLEEKNVPTSPEKWAQAKAQAKAKFDVYPSAYANGWAAKKYKEMGGGWKSVSEEIKDKTDVGEYDQEGDMAKSDLRSIIANAQKMHDMIDDADNLPEWVQAKITKAEDYISTVANYMTSEMNEEVEQIEEMPGANMDTRAVHKHLKKQGWNLSRTSGSHDVYTHSDAKHHIAVPRHKQLKAPLVKAILKQSEVNEAHEMKNPPFEGPYKKPQADQVKDKSGAVHTPMSRVKHLAKMAARKNAGIKEPGSMKKEEVENMTPAKRTISKNAETVKDLVKNSKNKKVNPDTFQSEPELSSNINKQ